MFSLGMFKSNLKRFWIIPFIVTIVLFVGITFQMILEVEEVKKDERENPYINNVIIPETSYQSDIEIVDTVNRIESNIPVQETEVQIYEPNYERTFMRFLYNPINIVIIFILPVILSILLFSYMNEEKSSSFIHGLPISKKKLYITNILTGIFMYLLPYVINTIILLLLNLGDMGNYLPNAQILKWFGINILYNTIFFSFSTLIGMFCASKISHGILTYILMYAPIGLIAFGSMLLEEIIFGFNAFASQIEEFALKIPFIKIMENFNDMMYYYSNTELNLSMQTVIIYIIASIIMLFIGYLLYKRRKLEITKEFIAFKRIQSFIKYAATLTVNLLSYMYFYSIFDENEISSIIGSLIVTTIAYFIIEMILKKTYKVFKSIKELIIYIIIIMVLYATAINGALGFETKIPQIDNIKEVSIIRNEEKITFDEKENIKNILNLHQKIVNDRDKAYTEYVIEYTLKNGNKINRKYAIRTNTYKRELEKIFSSDEYIEEVTKSLKEINDIENIEVTISYKDEKNRYDRREIDISNKDKQNFINSLLQDIKNRKAEVQTNYNTIAVKTKNENNEEIVDIYVRITMKNDTSKTINYINMENIEIWEYIK